ncbi:MAG: DUF3015 domain-containing protein [Oligoflexia bacterium]|nr:DUF3015 domain-containing protein [Oligoflexia bacterium]
MKKIGLILGVALCVALVTDAEAARRRNTKPSNNYEAPRSMSSGGHRMAGCGLGSTVIEDDDKWAQVGAAFLNGTGFQTFAISFGTSNCTTDGVAQADKEGEIFVESNYSEIQRDLAAGKGEYLDGLVNVYGCEDVGSFKSNLIAGRKEFTQSKPETASNVVRKIANQSGC